MQQRQGPRVLEIGSRRIVAPVDRDRLGRGAEYVGMDILAGPNVDVVGDAHDLRPHFADASFDGVISLAVFEHIAMPWKVALEINRVLKPGGLVYIATHHVYPIHELPWDFYRYGYEALATCFGSGQGFEPISKLLGWSAHVFPDGGVMELDRDHEHFLFTGLLARKVGDFDPEANRWDADYREALPERHEYPEGTYVQTGGGERYGGPAVRQEPRVARQEDILSRASADVRGSILIIANEETTVPTIRAATIERVRRRDAATDLRSS